MEFSKAEAIHMGGIVARLGELRTHLNEVDLDETSDIGSWFRAIAKVKAIQGNVSNDLSFIACLLAKAYLREHFGVTTFDAGKKPQGAPGLDIDVVTSDGARLVAEIKTTVPYSGASNDLGAQQKASFRRDFAKLSRTNAAHKLLFVTDPATLKVIRQRYAKEIPGVQIVLLDPEAV